MILLKFEGKQWLHIESDIDKLPLYVKEGAIIPMGPIMQYIDEFETTGIDLYIAPYSRDGKTIFNIPVNGKIIKVEYFALKGEHTVQIEKCAISFNVIVLGNEEIKIVKI